MRQAEHQDKNNPGETAAAPEFPGIPHKTVRATSQQNPRHRQHAQRGAGVQGGGRPHQPRPT